MSERLPGFAEDPYASGAQLLHVAELGDGDASVAFLHGIGGTTRYWTSTGTAPVFRGKRTRLIDLYGFGDSPRPWCRYTLDRHLEALQRTLDQDRPQVLVGHSLGAALALCFAARYPHRVSALILIGLPHYGSPAKAFAWFRSQRGGWLYTNLLATMLACIVSRRIAGRWLPYLVRNVPRVVAEDLVKHNAMSSATSLWNVLYRHDLAAEAEALAPHIPVLCVHGTHDATAPVASVRGLRTRHPNWQLVELDCDHHPWLRAPARCHAAIAQLLAATRTASSPTSVAETKAG